jgi:hypothetical protein
MGRGDFVKNMQSLVPNEYRFANEDDFDRSTFLSKVKRVKGLNFKGYQQRDSENLIKQGGDITKSDLLKSRTRPEEFYDGF